MVVAEQAVLVAHGFPVSTVTGAHVQCVNLDSATGAPALRTVVEAMNALLPWHSSVQRGAGSKYQVTTAADGMERVAEEAVDLVGPIYLTRRPQ